MRRHDNLERDRAIVRAVKGGLSMRRVARQFGLYEGTQFGNVMRRVIEVRGAYTWYFTGFFSWVLDFAFGEAEFSSSPSLV